MTVGLGKCEFCVHDASGCNVWHVWFERWLCFPGNANNSDACTPTTKKKHRHRCRIALFFTVCQVVSFSERHPQERLYAHKKIAALSGMVGDATGQRSSEVDHTTATTSSAVGASSSVYFVMFANNSSMNSATEVTPET